MAVNVTAAMLAAKYAIPHMRDDGRRRRSSTSRPSPQPTGSVPVPTPRPRPRCIGLTKDWAYLHGRDGIRVNCLVLGHVDSPMGMSGGGAGREQRRRAGLLGTEATAWDVAWPAVFLASEESRWITGVALPVDAGTTSSTVLGIETLNERFSD